MHWWTACFELSDVCRSSSKVSSFAGTCNFSLHHDTYVPLFFSSQEIPLQFSSIYAFVHWNCLTLLYRMNICRHCRGAGFRTLPCNYCHPATTTARDPDASSSSSSSMNDTPGSSVRSSPGPSGEAGGQ